MIKLFKKIQELSQELDNLKNEVLKLYDNNGNEALPYANLFGLKDPADNFPVDIQTGLGGLYGGSIFWNDAELAFPPWGLPPLNPTIGYHKHTHSEFAGGALDINGLELIEYVIDSSTHSLNSQGFWATTPSIKTVAKPSDGSVVEKKGLLAIDFDPETATWSAGKWVAHVV